MFGFRLMLRICASSYLTEIYSRSECHFYSEVSHKKNLYFLYNDLLFDIACFSHGVVMEFSV